MKYELDFQTISAPVKRMVIFHYDHKKSEDKFPFISVNLKCLYKVELFFLSKKSPNHEQARHNRNIETISESFWL